MNIDINPEVILKGVFELDRDTLSILLALFEDSKVTSIILDKIRDAKSAIKGKYGKLTEQEFILSKEHFSQRLQITSQNILKSEASLDELRIALWVHLLDAYNIDSDVVINPREAQIAVNNLASEAAQTISKQKNNTSPKKLKSFIRKVNPFSKYNPTAFSFEEAIQYTLSNLMKSIFEDKKIHDDEVINAFKSEILKLDKSILNESGFDNLTDEAIKKVLTTSGGLIGLAGITQISGFGAYIFAAQASAIIPLVGGKTLISLLFVLTSPLFFIPAILTVGVAATKKSTKSIKKAFGSTVISILALQGLESKKDIYDISRVLFESDNILNKLNNSDLLNSGHVIKKISNISQLKENTTLPASPNISVETANFLKGKVSPPKKDSDVIHSILFPNSEVKETAALAGITFADFIFDLASIDSRVLEAADFARKSDLSSPFDFAKFTEGLEGLPIRSLIGHQSNIMGYTAERVVACKLVENGHLVSIPESSTQPGFDLLVDGAEFQVKCIKPENFSILERHFERYPNTPAFVNSELAPVIAEKSPEWIDQVFFLEGYTYDFTDELEDKAIEAGQELGDYDIISSIAIISAAKNIHSWWNGQQSINSSAFNILLDSASKGTMAIAGGFVGSGIGMFMFGPAGAYIVGGVSSVVGATKGNWAVDLFDASLMPKKDRRLKEAADNLLNTCNDFLNKKLVDIDSKIKSLLKSEIGSFVKYRLEWEKVFVQTRINKNNNLINNKTLKGRKKISKSLKLASQSSVHSYWLQTDYNIIANLLSEKVDRWEAIKDKASYMTSN